MGLSPFVISAGINALGSLFGRRDEEAQARENAERANQMSRENATIAWQRNVKASDRANRWSERQATIAEHRSDNNAQISRRFNAQQANKANRFTADQNDLAYERSEARDLRNREWAQEDYEQQKADYASQFTRLREAAVAGGFNPLSVLGSQMTPSIGAGGLSSSAYGAGVGVGASSGFSAAGAPTPSVPMAYAADVSVQPLVSNAGVVGSISEFGREITGANAVQRKTDQLYLDLAQIQLDQARSGFSGALPGFSGGNFPAAPAGVLPAFRPTAMPAGPISTSDTFTDPYGNEWRTDEMPRPWRLGTDGMPVEYVPTPHSSMTGIVSNEVTGGNAYVPLDPSGELLNRSQMVDVGVLVAPQAANNHTGVGARIAQGVRDGAYAAPRGGQFWDWWNRPPVPASNVTVYQPADPWQESYNW